LKKDYWECHCYYLIIDGLISSVILKTITDKITNGLFFGDMSYFTKGCTNKIKCVFFFVWRIFFVCKFIGDYITKEIINRIEIIEESFSDK
jgi:hypothetical protein